MADQRPVYDLRSVKLPYLAGLPLRLMVALLESPLRGLLAPSLLRSAGVASLRQQLLDEPPGFHPLGLDSRIASAEGLMPEQEWPGSAPQRERGFQYARVRDYARAYRSGQVTPQEVAQRVLDAIRASDDADPPLRAFIAVDAEDVLAQAKRSTQRLKEGRSLSVLDGVPVAVKDELDMVPYPTTVGTRFLGRKPAGEDATVVARLRATGALLLGKANMHEVGIGVTGFNLHHGTPRNPYHPGHYTGGSSSGPAAAVAAGFCPVAVGADGGGSIRIPSAFCGIVGLMPTYGRLPHCGAAPLTWSLDHLGPLAATVEDAALAYAVMAGPDSQDSMSVGQPTPTVQGWEQPDLSGLSLGVYWPWFRHAAPDVVAACVQMLGWLEEAGARVKEVTIPDLELGRVAHTVIIASEIRQAQGKAYVEHYREYGLDVRLNLAVAGEFTAGDYIKAQRVRTRMAAHFARVLTEVDAIVTPATAVTASPILERALTSGESDLSTLVEIMRFATPANMTGLPAISFPAGYNEDGLPIGMQATGGAWQEPVLLRVALAAERALDRKEPRTFYPILG